MLEQEVKQALGVTEKFKITIAEMIISHANGIGHGARGEGYVKRALVSMRHVPCESDL
jgi:hypothetical protein